MKLNIANPRTGHQKLIEIEDDRKLAYMMEKRMGSEVAGDPISDEFKGYVFRITGGNDKQGFPMKEGVLKNGRVRLLLKKGHSCYRPRRTGERKRKSVRGCIVGHDMAVISLVVVKEGEANLGGLKDDPKPIRLGPKRASKIRKLFNLSKEDDVRKYVIRRELPAKEGKKATSKAPKIQRLVTPVVLQRKRARLAHKRKRAEASKKAAADYAVLLAKRQKEHREKLQKKRLNSRKESEKVRRDSEKVKEAPKKEEKPAKKDVKKDAKKDTKKDAKKETKKEEKPVVKKVTEKKISKKVQKKK